MQSAGGLIVVTSMNGGTGGRKQCVGQRRLFPCSPIGVACKARETIRIVDSNVFLFDLSRENPWPKSKPLKQAMVCPDAPANMAAWCWPGDQAVGLGRSLPDGWFCGINRTEDLTCTAVNRWRRRKQSVPPDCVQTHGKARLHCDIITIPFDTTVTIVNFSSKETILFCGHSPSAALYNAFRRVSPDTASLAALLCMFCMSAVYAAGHSKSGRAALYVLHECCLCGWKRCQRRTAAKDSGQD